MFLQDCAEIADFFTELVDAVGDVSLQLRGDDTVQVVDGMVHPYKGRSRLCCPPGLWGEDHDCTLLGGLASGARDRVPGLPSALDSEPDCCDSWAVSHALSVMLCI